MTGEDPIRERIQPSTPTVRELAMVLFRQRRVFVWVSGLVFGLSILYAACGTEYRSEMKVLVRRGRAEAPVSALPSAALDLTRTAVTEEELNSEVELLRDPSVLRKVAEQVPSNARNWSVFLHPWQTREQAVERAARRLAKAVRVEPIKKTDLITVSYSSGSPAHSAAVLQALAAVYLQRHLEVHRPKGESPFFEQQAAESGRSLESAQNRLIQFTSSNGVVSAALQRDLTLQKLAEWEANARQTDIELAETKQRVRDLRDQLSRLPERTTTQVRTSDNPELLKALKSNLLELQLRRRQLVTKFEPNHRLVQEVEEQISIAQAAITGERLSPVHDETTDKNPQFEWAKSELQHAEIQLTALQAKHDAIVGEAIMYRAYAEKLGKDAITQDHLIASAKAAEESHLLYVKKQDEARMNDALDEQRIVNVALAEEPVVPALPVWSMSVILVVGFCAAGLGGAASAFVANYLDSSFRTPEELGGVLDVPVLASLPRELPRRLSA